MRRGKRWGAVGALLALCLCLGGGVHAQKKATGDPFAGKMLPATQEMLADTALQGTLDLVWAQIDAHGHKGEYNHYVNLSRFVVEGNPAQHEAYATAAHLLWSTDRTEEGVALIKEGIKRNPKHYYLYDEMGRFYLTNMKDPKTAIPYYEQAVKYKCPWMTYNMLGICYEKTNQWAKAVATLEKATLYTDNPRAKSRLENARAQLAKQKGNK